MDETRHGNVATGAALGCLGVGLGAFGAHGLEGFLEGAAEAATRTEWWETAAHYHLVHAVAIVAVAGALRGQEGGRKAVRAATWCFAMGIGVFSGSLYALALGAPKWFGAITPIGGLFLMAGWAVLGLAAWRPARDG